MSERIVLAQVPTTLSYQGRVSVLGTNFNGTGQFKFALVSLGTNLNRQATVTATVSFGFLVNITVSDSGEGYLSPPSVTITDSSGSGASAVAQVSGGRVTGVTVQQTGSGYSSSPVVTLGPPQAAPVVGTYWSNDGSSTGGSEPANAVSAGVAGGLFTVLLGDTNLGNMLPIPVTIFQQRSDAHVRIWFNNGTLGFVRLAPDHPVSSVGYAMNAATVAPGGVTAASLADGSVTSAKLGNGAVTSNQIANGSIALVDLSAQVLGSFWRTSGNAGTTSGTSFLGTTDNQPLELRVGNQRALRLEPNATSPNVIAGFRDNYVSNSVVGAVIGGGGSPLSGGTNSVLADYGTISGGSFNLASGLYATIAGGFGNAATNYAVIGGGSENVASGYGSTIAGGDENIATGAGATISGGEDNQAQESSTTIGGGYENRTSGPAATIAGGGENVASGPYASIGGGNGNEVRGGTGATIAGGIGNTILQNIQGDQGQTIAGGSSNIVQGQNAVVGGGEGNAALGFYGTIPGGRLNQAATHAFAAGNRAKAVRRGTFVWADSTEADLITVADNEFLARASGGVAFFSTANLSVGVKVNPGANAWSPMSDRNVKENFKPIDAREVLEKVSAMPITEWNLKTQDASIRHLGPMAQDFRAAFGLGEDERHISTTDADGVALAAIQGLHAVVKEKDAEIQALKQSLVEVKEALAKLASRNR